MVCRPAADSYRCRPAIMHDLCDRTALLLKEGVLVQIGLSEREDQECARAMRTMLP